MEKKIICIFVSMLMCATVFSVTGTTNDNKNEEVSMGLAPDFKLVTNEPIIQTQPLLYDPAKAFIAYDPSADEGPCEFNLGTPGTITLLQAWAPGSNGFCAGAAWTMENKWFMCEYSTSSSIIWDVDPANGNHVQVGPAGVSLHAMTYDVTTKTMYGAGGSGNAANLYTIDQGTGAATLVGAFGSSLSYMLMLACDGSGNMYGIDISTDSLYSINKGTGAATLIGSTGQALNYAQDMCYDIDNDILYAAGYSGGGKLYTCNVATGALTLVGAFQNNAEIDAFAIPYITNEPPLTPDAPTGPDQGVTNVEYTFTASTTDPEGDPIEYWFEWGDGENSGWVSPGSAKHAWTSAGAFEVTVKARDDNGGESDFSPAHIINIISGPLIEIKKVKGGLFRVTAQINNTGATTATDVQWTITIEGGAWTGKETNGTIDSIPAGTGVQVKSKLVLGFGKIKVTVTAEVPESSDMETRNGAVYLIFVKVNPGGG